MRANPTVTAVAAEGFLTRLGFGMVSLALPLFALSLGMSLAEVGLLTALRTVAVIGVKPIMGWAADRYGRKTTLVIAVLLRCLVGLLFVFASEPWHLYALRILQGAMTAARDPSAAALLATHGKRKSMASTFAWYTTARDVGRSLGYGAAGLLIEFTGGFQAVFLIAFLTSCIAMVTVLKYVSESPEVAPAAAGSQPAPPAEPHMSRSLTALWTLYARLIPYAGFGLMVASSAEMMRGIFPVLATEYAHLTDAQAGLAVSASSVAVLVAGPLFAWLSDHVSRKLALGARSAANTLSSVLYIVAPTFGGFMAAKIIDDSGKAAFRPTWGAILAEVSDVDPLHRARTITFVDSAYSMGEIVGPMAAGLLLALVGIPGMLAARAALAVVTEAHAFWIFRRSAKRLNGAAVREALPAVARKAVAPVRIGTPAAAVAAAAADRYGAA
jgi:MFS family permease